MVPIASILPELPYVKIVDVGAMSLGEGGDPYTRMTEAFLSEVLGCEPNIAECEKLNAYDRKTGSTLQGRYLEELAAAA